MSKFHFSNAHFYKDVVDNDDRRQRIDRRLRPENRNFRTNIRDRMGHRSYIDSNEFLEGTMYRGSRRCVRCNEMKLLKEFENATIHEANRSLNGFNIACRTCQRNEYSCGYKVDGFIIKTAEEDPVEYDADVDFIPQREEEVENTSDDDESSDTSNEEQSLDNESYDNESDDNESVEDNRLFVKRRRLSSFSSEESDENEDDLSSFLESDNEDDQLSFENGSVDEEQDDDTYSETSICESQEDTASEESLCLDEESYDESSSEESFDEDLDDDLISETEENPSHSHVNVRRHILFDESDNVEPTPRVTFVNERHMLFDDDSDEKESLTPLPHQLSYNEEEESDSDDSVDTIKQNYKKDDIPDMYVDGEAFYIVEKILDAVYNKQTKKWSYYIKWENFDNSFNSWEPAECLHPDLIHEYHFQH